MNFEEGGVVVVTDVNVMFWLILVPFTVMLPEDGDTE